MNDLVYFGKHNGKKTFSQMINDDESYVIYMFEKINPHLFPCEIKDYLLKCGLKWPTGFINYGHDTPTCLCGEIMNKFRDKTTFRIYFKCPKIEKCVRPFDKKEYSLSGYIDESDDFKTEFNPKFNTEYKKPTPTLKPLPWTRDLIDKTAFITKESDPPGLKAIHKKTREMIDWQFEKVKRIEKIITEK